MGEIRRPTYRTPSGEAKESRVWWIRYYRNGRRYEESARTTKKQEALALLRRKEGKIADGVPVRPDRLTFDEGAADLLNDYITNKRRSIAVVRRRVRKHLTPFFGGRRLASITVSDVRAYIAHRHEQGVIAVRGQRKGERVKDVSNAEINRELQHLKRIFRLALQAEKIWRVPHIPLLKESSPRSGFFERDQFEAVRRHLPADLQPVVTFAYITGWRVPSEVLTLQWTNVDFKAGVVSLDFGVTKNEDARVFPFTSELRTVLEAQKTARDVLRAQGDHLPLGVLPNALRGQEAGRGAAHSEAHYRVQEGVDERLSRGRPSGPHPARLQAYERAEPHTRRRAGKGGYGNDRTQDP